MASSSTAQNLDSSHQDFVESDEAPTTQRIRPFDLAKALQQVSADFDEEIERERKEAPFPALSMISMSKPKQKLLFDLISDDPQNDDSETTMMVDPETNKRLVARTSFNPDDEITVDAPAPSVPAGTPSPLGDDNDEQPSSRRSPCSARQLDLDFPDAIPELAPILTPEAPLSDLPYVSSSQRLNQSGLELDRGAAISGIRLCVTPKMKQQVREAREATRVARVEQLRTRVIVAVIWLLAVALASLLAFIASSP